MIFGQVCVDDDAHPSKIDNFAVNNLCQRGESIEKARGI